MTYERIKAGEIRPGDRVARARTHPFRLVKAVSLGAKAISIHYDDPGRHSHDRFDRPRRVARWWREA